MANRVLQVLRDAVAGKRRLQRFWERVHFLSLLGMHIGSGYDCEKSGEMRALHYIGRCFPEEVTPVVFDVGANEGNYARKTIAMLRGKLSLHCFEPSKVAFDKLESALRDYPGAKRYNFGFGDVEGFATLYSDAPGSGLSSVYRRRIEYLDIHMDETEEIRIRRLDDFCREHAIPFIHFLKLDVEGHELKVLQGAEELINSSRIGFIQFEFGGCNIDSRTYLKDFFLLLDPKYRLNRMVKDGIVPLERYKETDEIFTTTNFLAVSRNLQVSEGIL